MISGNHVESKIAKHAFQVGLSLSFLPFSNLPLAVAKGGERHGLAFERCKVTLLYMSTIQHEKGRDENGGLGGLYEIENLSNRLIQNRS